MKELITLLILFLFGTFFLGNKLLDTILGLFRTFTFPDSLSILNNIDS